MAFNEATAHGASPLKQLESEAGGVFLKQGNNGIFPKDQQANADNSDWTADWNYLLNSNNRGLTRLYFEPTVRHRITPFHLAIAKKCPFDQIRQMLDKHIELLHCETDGGDLPLHYAAATHNTELVELLTVLDDDIEQSLKHASRATSPLGNQVLPLHAALYARAPLRLILLLVQYCPETSVMKDGDGNSPIAIFHQAFKQDNAQDREILKILMHASWKQARRKKTTEEAPSSHSGTQERNASANSSAGGPTTMTDALLEQYGLNASAETKKVDQTGFSGDGDSETQNESLIAQTISDKNAPKEFKTTPPIRRFTPPPGREETKDFGAAVKTPPRSSGAGMRTPPPHQPKSKPRWTQGFTRVLKRTASQSLSTDGARRFLSRNRSMPPSSPPPPAAKTLNDKRRFIYKPGRSFRNLPPPPLASSADKSSDHPRPDSSNHSLDDSNKSKSSRKKSRSKSGRTLTGNEKRRGEKKHQNKSDSKRTLRSQSDRTLASAQMVEKRELRKTRSEKKYKFTHPKMVIESQTQGASSRALRQPERPNRPRRFSPDEVLSWRQSSSDRADMSYEYSKESRVRSLPEFNVNGEVFHPGIMTDESIESRAAALTGLDEDADILEEVMQEMERLRIRKKKKKHKEDSFNRRISSPPLDPSYRRNFTPDSLGPEESTPPSRDDLSQTGESLLEDSSGLVSGNYSSSALLSTPTLDDSQGSSLGSSFNRSGLGAMDVTSIVDNSGRDREKKKKKDKKKRHKKHHKREPKRRDPSTSNDDSGPSQPTQSTTVT